MEQQRILIVDDDPDILLILCSTLASPEGGNYSVQKCDSGEAALQHLKDSPFDLLITDLCLPGMTGLELLEQAYMFQPTIRSILVTGFGSSEVEDKARRLANAYVLKPFGIKSLIATIQKTLDVAQESRPQWTMSSQEGLRLVQERMDLLCSDVTALGAQLLDPSGQVLAESGRRGDFDSTTFLALLGNAMAATNEVSRMLDDKQAFDLHFHEGAAYEVYTARLNDQIFLSLLVDRGHRTRIGMVWLYLRRAIADLRELLANVTLTSGVPMSEDMQVALDSALDSVFTSGSVALPAEPGTRGEIAWDPIAIADLSPAPVPDRTPQSSQPAPSAETETPGLDGKRMLSFDEARALGLINLD